MWLFGRRAKIEQHKALLAQAEQVLTRFPLLTPIPNDDRNRFDVSDVSLEFRSKVSEWVDNLHGHVRASRADRDNYGRRYLGHAEHLRTLAANVRYMQMYLSDTFPPQVRLVFRAADYAELFKSVARIVEDFGKAAPMGHVVERAEWALPLASEVLGWFPDEAALEEARRALPVHAEAPYLMPRAAAAALTDKLREHIEKHG